MIVCKVCGSSDLDRIRELKGLKAECKSCGNILAEEEIVIANDIIITPLSGGILEGVEYEQFRLL